MLERITDEDFEEINVGFPEDGEVSDDDSDYYEGDIIHLRRRVLETQYA